MPANDGLFHEYHILTSINGGREDVIEREALGKKAEEEAAEVLFRVAEALERGELLLGETLTVQVKNVTKVI